MSMDAEWEEYPVVSMVLGKQQQPQPGAKAMGNMMMSGSGVPEPGITPPRITWDTFPVASVA